MEGELNELEQHSQIEGTTLGEMMELSQEILGDCQLKKGKKAKFIKHMDRIATIDKEMEAVSDRTLLLAAAALFKNLGKLGEHEDTLQRAVELLGRAGGLKTVMVRWMLQIAALKSSKKEHQQCYDIAVRTFRICEQIVQEKLEKKEEGEEGRSQRLFAEKVMEIARENTKDQIIWLVNERCIAEEILQQLRKSADPDLYIPFYPSEDFHIADIMSLEECQPGWQQARQGLKPVVTYLSICCFTMATEKYYQKDYSQKVNHIKSLKLALCSFDINCSYVSFLLKILNQHFGRRMQPIEEEHSETAERFEMRRALPKDKKEVSLKYLQFAE